MSLTSAHAAAYRRDGFLSPVTVIDPARAGEYRRRLETAEQAHGPLHYQVKPHLLLTVADELAHEPVLLACLESLLGPALLLWDSAFIIKEPHSAAKVSWHQDLTYWGLENDEVVSVWLALSPADAASGAMLMVPGSHRDGALPHHESVDADNVLSRGQTLDRPIDPSAAVQTVLAPGQMSLHHGWVFHASQPNRSDDRRIGFNMNVTTPGNRQRLFDGDSALLLRGRDRYRHFREEPRPLADFPPEGVAFQAQASRLRAHEVNRGAALRLAALRARPPATGEAAEPA